MRSAAALAAVLFIGFCGTCLADQIKGKIAAVDPGRGSIVISGIMIDAGSARIRNEAGQPADLSGLAEGDFVEAEGYSSAPGRMTAMKVDKDLPGRDGIRGRIERVDIARRTVHVGGVAVLVPRGIPLEGHGGMKIMIEQLGAASNVECRGEWTGEAELTADKVRVE